MNISIRVSQRPANIEESSCSQNMKISYDSDDLSSSYSSDMPPLKPASAGSSLSSGMVTESSPTGYLRFTLAMPPPDIQERLMDLSDEEYSALQKLKTNWLKAHPKQRYEDGTYLRFLQCSPGKVSFNPDSARMAMEKFDPQFLALSQDSMRQQLLTKTLFPIPQLRSVDGHDCFYMRPSRYFPKDTPASVVIDNLCYVLSGMVRSSATSAEQGVAFIANMNGWTMQNFAVDYCFQFMQVLQGRTFPIKVNMFLIVNPPSWFNVVWKMMKPMLGRHFRRKVHMISESKLPKYLMEGYEKHLVDEFKVGQACTNEVVGDYIEYRKRTDLAKEEF